MRLKIKIPAIILTTVLGFALWPGTSLAGSGYIYVAPASASVQKGHDLTVSLRINPGTTINSVQAKVVYNSSDLEYLSYSIGIFSTCAQTPSSGDISFACAKLAGSTSSDSLIASIAFKALAGSGGTALEVTGAEAANNGTYTNPAASSGSVSFTSPVSSSSGSSSGPTSSSSYSNSGSTSSSSTPASTSKPAAKPKPSPKITITSKLESVGFTNAQISVSTNVAVPVFVRYGLSAAKLSLQTPLSKAGTNETITLPSSSVTPATTYYYQAVSKDSNGKLTYGKLGQFTTKGFTVSVTVLDANYQPLAGQVVTLHSAVMQARTNSKGVAIFTNVAPGLHHIEYTLRSRTYSSAIYVSNNFTTTGSGQTAPTQTAAVILASYRQPKKPSHTTIIIVVIVLLALIVAGLIGLGAKRIFRRFGTPKEKFSGEADSAKAGR